jgi:hypothetical protein
MSSKVKITFYFHNDANLLSTPEDMPPSSATFIISENAVIQHIRNYEINSNGGVIISPNGGHTIMCTEDLAMYVSRCNYRTDKFSRKEGLKQVFMKWLDHNQFKDYTILHIKCYQDNKIDVFVTKVF